MLKKRVINVDKYLKDESKDRIIFAHGKMSLEKGMFES